MPKLTVQEVGSFDVPAGTQELKWQFKDRGATGQDRGWVDQVEFASPAAAPLQSFSSPTVASITVSDGKVILAWGINPGKAYQVFYKDSLSETEWKLLPGQPSINDSVATLEDVVGRLPQRFYQIMEY